jgi:hypothetical protein
MKTALFIDFDNVYSGLRKLGPAYADAFAGDPLHWMAWITSKLCSPADTAPEAKRRILVRRCYLNPTMYQRFRLGFSRAGFEIVDCPPMTQQGKTSTDIHMVLDIVDVLQSPTRYDEFIVFSGDADFTPVLRKLRRDDRRTTIFAAGATSASYDASADLIIDLEAFISEALGFGDEEPMAPAVLDDDGLVTQAEALVWKLVEQAQGPVQLPTLTKALATQVPGLADSNWAGRGSFTALLKELPLGPLRIDKDANALVDPRRQLREQAQPSRARADALKEAAKAMPSDVRGQIERLVADEVAASARPVAVAKLAHLVRQRFVGIEGDWLGCGSWKRLLESLHLGSVQIMWVQLAGYALDPARHSADFANAPRTVDRDDPKQDPRWTRVEPLIQAAGFPVMACHKYRAVLESMAEALQDKPFSLTNVTRRARDLCAERQVPVPRSDVTALLRALLFNGFDPSRSKGTVDDLVSMACDVAAAACSREGLDIGQEGRQALRSWLLSPSAPVEAATAADTKP